MVKISTMEIKGQTFVSLPAKLFGLTGISFHLFSATQRSTGHVSALVAIWHPSVTQCPSWLLGLLATKRPYNCLALPFTTRCPPGCIGRKHPKAIDTARKFAISGMISPHLYFFITCQMQIVRGYLSWSCAGALEIISLKKSSCQSPHQMELECPHPTAYRKSPMKRLVAVQSRWPRGEDACTSPLFLTVRERSDQCPRPAS